MHIGQLFCNGGSNRNLFHRLNLDLDGLMDLEEIMLQFSEQEFPLSSSITILFVLFLCLISGINNILLLIFSIYPNPRSEDNEDAPNKSGHLNIL